MAPFLSDHLPTRQFKGIQFPARSIEEVQAYTSTWRVSMVRGRLFRLTLTMTTPIIHVFIIDVYISGGMKCTNISDLRNCTDPGFHPIEDFFRLGKACPYVNVIYYIFSAIKK